eukprot:GGOE01061957.1.p1 GENE.GGOE01061957.1~~GGOE01061957.1.p1  ORF type:complete len:504 (+),score=103.83 GGOE01061957.1:130-1512(+)
MFKKAIRTPPRKLTMLPFRPSKPLDVARLPQRIDTRLKHIRPQSTTLLSTTAALATLCATTLRFWRRVPRDVPSTVAMAASVGQAAVQKVPAAYFFEHLFGFRENTFNLQTVYDSFIVTHSPAGVTIRSRANGREFRAGTFQLCSLPDLQRKVKLPAGPKPGTLSLIIGEGIKGPNVRQVDVGALQADPSNNGATFQVASNFNCLEFINNQDCASYGVSKYIFDQTQGPAASISCAPGLLYRNYFVRHSHNGVQYEGQLRRQFNALSALPLDVVNGFVNLEVTSLERLAGVVAEQSKYFALAQVGVHSDVQVTSGLKGAIVELCPDDAQTVNQVFTAALNLAGLPPEVRADPAVVGLARLLLRVAYRLTVLAGLSNSQRQQGRKDRPGSNRLYLTLIGGGVFANDVAWIHDAIQENRELIKQSGLDVRLSVHNRHSLSPANLQAFEQLALATGGTITVAK